MNIIVFLLTILYLMMQVIDLATLTGACVVALGPSIAGQKFTLLFIYMHDTSGNNFFF